MVMDGDSLVENNNQNVSYISLKVRTVCHGFTAV